MNKAAQQAITNLDQDVTKSRMDKYHKSEPEIKSWIFSVLKVPQSQIQQYESRHEDLLEILKSGLLLCQLGQLLNIPNNPSTKCKNSRMPFVQMENISFFLSTCEIIGVSHDEIFQTVDLFDRKDPYQIIVTLISFSRSANSINNSIPVIGPKVAKIRPNIPTKPINLRAK